MAASWSEGSCFEIRPSHRQEEVKWKSECSQGFTKNCCGNTSRSHTSPRNPSEELVEP
jgi:hypothetical protein